jgi:hypothetical protein
LNRYRRPTATWKDHACYRAPTLAVGRSHLASQIVTDGKTEYLGVPKTWQTFHRRLAAWRLELPWFVSPSLCITIHYSLRIVSDPSIINVDGVWYSFATRTIGSNIHIQAAQSDDFNTFSLVQNNDGTQYDALPDLPGWVNSTSWNTWAPDVQQMDDGSFVMYISANHLLCAHD